MNHLKIDGARREIIMAFNYALKRGINKINEICIAHNISPISEQIALFFLENKRDLDLEKVGEYLGDEKNLEVLDFFTQQINFKGQSFTEGLRVFLKAFKLPGESQKIDRLVERFSKSYYAQNKDIDDDENQVAFIDNEDAAYLLAFQVIMLNTDLHSPKIPAKNKMSMDQMKKNLRGCNNKGDFDGQFLEDIYNNIKAKAFEFNFVKTAPGYQLTSSTLDDDPTFKKVHLLLQSPHSKIHEFFSGIDSSLKATVDKPKAWLNFLTGYEGTLKLTDKSGKELVAVHIYMPNLFSKWLFGEHSKVIIQPVYKDENTKEAIELAAKITANFKSPVNIFKATYDYELGDLINAYDDQKENIRQKLSIQKYKRISIVEESDSTKKNNETEMETEPSNASQHGISMK